MTNVLIKILFAVTALLLSMSAISQSGAKPVRIIGFGMHYGGNVIYRYQIKNNGNASINRIILGFTDEQNSKAKIGLSQVPIAPNLLTVGQWYSPLHVGSPDGWGAKLIAAASEGGEIGLEWIEGNYFKTLWPDAPLKGEDAPFVYPNSRAISPGQTADGFSVTVAVADFTYTTGPAIVDYGASLLSIFIEKGDAIPPTIILNVNRLNKNEGNGNWAIFNVKASTKDNYDPSPTLVFEPILSNQPLQIKDAVVHTSRDGWKIKLKNVPGRTYQMKFTSQDASGNTSVKTFDYAVAASNKKENDDHDRDDNKKNLKR